jgi:hypothetical protein
VATWNRSRRLALTLAAAACAAEPGLDPPPPGMTSATIGIGDGDGDTDGESDTDTDTDTDTDADPSCDPYADPATACPAGEKCNFTSETCAPVEGNAGLDEPCEVLDPDLVVDTCQAGLVCASDPDPRCLPPCLLATPTCDLDRVCGVVADPPPEGLCFEGCDLLDQDCSDTSDACYPIAGPTTPVAACLPEAQSGVEGDPCEAPIDCAAGYVCSDAAQHVLGCLDAAPSCCTPLCDFDLQPCVGANPICTPLGVADQPEVGYCTAL